MTRIGVVTFPGTLDDRDAARAVQIAGAEAVALWHKDADLHGVDAVVIPGGFSYGDYRGHRVDWYLQCRRHHHRSAQER